MTTQRKSNFDSRQSGSNHQESNIRVFGGNSFNEFLNTLRIGNLKGLATAIFGKIRLCVSWNTGGGYKQCQPTVRGLVFTALAMAAVFALPQHSQAQEISVEAVSPYVSGDTAEFRYTTSSQFSSAMAIRVNVVSERDNGDIFNNSTLFDFPANQPSVTISDYSFVFGTARFIRITVTVQSHGSTEPKPGMDTATVSRTEAGKPGISVLADKTEMMGGESAFFNLGLTAAPGHTVRHNLKVTWSPPGLVSSVCGATPANVATATSHTCNGIARFWSNRTDSSGGTITTDETKLSGSDGWIKVSADTEQDFSQLSNPVYSPVYNPQANTTTVIVKAPIEQKIEFTGWQNNFNGTVLVHGGDPSTYSDYRARFIITKTDSSTVEYQIETQKNDENKILSNVLSGSLIREGDWFVDSSDILYLVYIGNGISSLSPGDTRTSTLIITLKDNTGTVIDTERVTVTLRYPNLSASFEGGGTTKTITSDNSGNYPDVKANFTMSNNDGTNARIRSAGNWIEESSTFLTPSSVVAGNSAGVTQIDGEFYDNFENFRFGTWYVDDNVEKYIFRPNAAALDALDNGVSVTYTVSSLVIFGNLVHADPHHEISGTTQILTLTLTGNGFFNPVWIEAVSSEVLEGENAMAIFTLKTRAMPTAPIRYEVGNSTYLAQSDTGVKATTESFVASNDIYTLQISIPLLNNTDADNEPGEIVVEILPDDNGSDPERYSVHTDNQNFPHRASVIVLDDDSSIPFAIISSESSQVTEGEDIVFNFSLFPVQSGIVSVNFRMVQDGDFIPFGVPRSVRVSSEGAKLTIATDNDSMEEDDGSLTATVLSGEGYRGVGRSEKVTIADDDPNSTDSGRYSVAGAVITSILRESGTDPSSPKDYADLQQSALPMVSIEAMDSTIKEGEPAIFRISVDGPVVRRIAVRIMLSQSGDFATGPISRSVALAPEATESEFRIETDNDDVAESDGSITATILEDSGYILGDSKSSRITVTDDMDRQRRKVRVSNAVQSMVPVLLANTAARSLEMASERTVQSLNANPTSFELNGYSSIPKFLQSIGNMRNDEGTDWQTVMGESAFSLALLPESDGYSAATVWGVGDYRSLSGNGNSDGRMWEADAFTGQFGFDAQSGSGILTGLSISMSEMETDYAPNGNASMHFNAKSMGIHPYLGFVSSDGSTRLQAVAGSGVNRLELDQENYPVEFLNGRYHMAGLDGSTRIYSSSSLLADGDTELNLNGESWLAKQFVDPVAGVVDSIQLSSGHARLALVATHASELGSAGTVTPSFTIGMRGDGRNETSVFGYDVTSGLGYAALNGLTAKASGTASLTVGNLSNDWWIESSLEYDSDRDDLGVLFSSSQSWSSGDSSVDSYLWSSELLSPPGGTVASTGGGGFETRLGYGFKVGGSSFRVTPFGEVRLMNANGNAIGVGNGFSTGSGIDLDIGAVRNASKNGFVEQEFNLSGRVKW